MTKALRNQLANIEKALGLDGGDEAADDTEFGRGAADSLVPLRLEGEALVLLQQLRSMRGARPDAPVMVMTPRVLAEGGKTARSRRVVEHFAHALERHRELLARTAGLPSPWADTPRMIDLEPADYGVMPERRHLGLLP